MPDTSSTSALALAGAVATWHGSGGAEGGGSGATCAGQLPVGIAGLFGDSFDNPTDQTIVLESVRLGTHTNAGVVPA